ncbi:MAG: hypothetical protein RSB55_04385 [Oscillospiraceae bacterium]
MTLTELSKSYRQAAVALRGRMERLAAEERAETDSQKKLALHRRGTVLEAMWRDTRDIAVLLERYYERGYRRNAKYTL